jgi:cytoskeleton protein RodZ
MPSENLSAIATAPSSPGAQLRRAREARGESVHEVAYALKLSPRQVDALERDDFDALPGMAFLRGFMRNYARHVGLDAAPLLDAVQRLAGLGSPDLSPIRNADGDLPSGGSRRSGSFPAGVVVLVLLAMLAVGWYFDWFRTGGVTTSETVLEPAPAFAPAPSQSIATQSAIPLTPPQPLVVEPAAGAPGQLQSGAAVANGEAGAATAESQPATVAAPADEATAAPAPATDAAASPPPVAEASAPATTEAPAVVPAGNGQLSFRFGADSWVEVRDASGTILHSGTNRAGSTRSVQGKAPFTLVVGNAANVTLEQDGKPVDLAAHVRGSVARLTLR